jgi:hypothetical protein
VERRSASASDRDPPDLSVAVLARAGLSLRHAGGALGYPTAEDSGTHRTLDAGECVSSPSPGAGSSSGGGVLSTVGDALLGADVGAGATGHARPFASGGNTGTTTAPTRKSAGPGQRLPSQAQGPSDGDSYNEEKAEKEHEDRLCLRLFG